MTESLQGLIAERQSFARRACFTFERLLEGDETLSETVRLAIWHGSLPRGRGGSRWDVDFAVFLGVSSPTALLTETRRVAEALANASNELTLRPDVHYDGMPMWEAHTHLDPDAEGLPHVGFHTYRRWALDELTASFMWTKPKRPPASIFRMIESWVRFMYFYRHWVFEGEPIWDPNGLLSDYGDRGFLPADWFLQELGEVLVSVLSQYRGDPRGLCTIADSRKLALKLASAAVFCLEGVPMGRRLRWRTDLEDFSSQTSRDIILGVLNGDLAEVAAHRYWLADKLGASHRAHRR